MLSTIIKTANTGGLCGLSCIFFLADLKIRLLGKLSLHQSLWKGGGGIMKVCSFLLISVGLIRHQGNAFQVSKYLF